MGRVRDLALALCVVARTADAAMGAAGERDEDCAGRVCQPADVAGSSFGSATCSFGTPGCGYRSNARVCGAMCLTPGLCL